MELTPTTIPTESEGLRYLLALIIVLLSFPISDKIANTITNLTKSRSKTKYSRFLLSGFLTIIVRLITILMALLIGLRISGISSVYLISGVGLLSIILPLAFTEPLRDLACGILLLVFDRIRVGDYITVDNKFGRVSEVQAFSTNIKDPYTNIITEFPNSKLWSESVQSMYRSKELKLHMPLLISHRNNIKSLEGSIVEILTKNEKVINVDLSYTNQDQRGLLIDIVVTLKSKNVEISELLKELYRELKMGLQESGVVFIDGSTPVSLKYKSNSVAPVIVEGTHIEVLNK
tara:strand:+ start:9738 stop:10607 length:870 start_codon:yes stop_codon:yes gene_type:complete